MGRGRGIVRGTGKEERRTGREEEGEKVIGCKIRRRGEEKRKKWETEATGERKRKEKRR